VAGRARCADILVVAVLVSITFTQTPPNEKRVALVSGNGAYASSALHNPVNDAGH
jgi:hypothetical protein